MVRDISIYKSDRYTRKLNGVYCFGYKIATCRTIASATQIVYMLNQGVS
jgi:hypothetical protein